MIELIASVRLNEWCFQNEITICNFFSFIGHKKNESVYGGLFETDKGLLFQRHKWIKINKNKTSPKAYAEIQYTHKFVGEDIWNSFTKLRNDEYTSRDVMDMQSMNNE